MEERQGSISRKGAKEERKEKPEKYKETNGK